MREASRGEASSTLTACLDAAPDGEEGPQAKQRYLSCKQKTVKDALEKMSGKDLTLVVPLL